LPLGTLLDQGLLKDLRTDRVETGD
jgi:hypothetical protein